ncbi:MAG: hypothetical protein JSS04_03870 [Proteobacteria bacterium]|nr:hypothetical protein [Pseudomonadota bacterium]
MNRSLMAVSLCVVAVTLAPAARAQAVKSSVEISATTGVPEFRDPKTGMVWTPENVGQGGKPILPEDHAFDPTSQSAPAQVVLQRATAKPVGSVPVTAGPTVPIVTIENTMLRAVPGQRWQVIAYLNNNSNKPVDPVVECRFTNHGNPVSATRVTVSQIGPSVRAGFAVMGPRINYFVDKVSCQVTSP